MAERTITQLFDDLDQTEIAEGKGESIEFALHGTTYRIDLKRSNVTKFEKALAPFVEAATQLRGAKSSPRAATSTRRRNARPKNAGKNSTSAVRDWAAANGLEVNSRGRIPAAVQNAFDAAQKPGK